MKPRACSRPVEPPRKRLGHGDCAKSHYDTPFKCCLCNAGKRPRLVPHLASLSKNLALMTFNPRSATPIDESESRHGSPINERTEEIYCQDHPPTRERVLIIPQFVSVLGDHLGRAWHQRQRHVRGHHRPAAREDRGLLQPGLSRSVCSARRPGGFGAGHHGLCEGWAVRTDLQA